VRRRAQWIGTAAVVVAAIAWSGASAATQRTAASPRAPWTIRIASDTTTTPGWAYPFASADELTTSNVDRFQQLMYRPLYNFGSTGTVSLNAAASLAYPPVYTNGNATVSVTLKPGLKWSNGQRVTAQGVMEWMNLLAAYPGMWGDYLAPLRDSQLVGIPDDVRDVTVAGNTVTFTLAGPVNPTWFTDNELSQITPLPQSWDVYEPAHPHLPSTGPTSIRGAGGHYTGPVAPAGCYGTLWIGDGNTGPSRTFVDPLGTKTVVVPASVAQAQRCVDVVYLLRSMSADTPDYTTAGTAVAGAWRTSDGPWRLAAFHAGTGAITMTPNLAAGASGAEPTAAALAFVPCAGPAACEALVAAGQVDQGPLPLADAPKVGSLGSAPRHNPLAKKGYRETVAAPWATSYMPYNFDSRLGAAGHAGMVFRQLYFRQAVQELVDQRTMIAQGLAGYGVATDGPVPTLPRSAYSASVSSPYHFSVAKAASLLASHGWHVAPGKVATCTDAAKCGAGIPKGTPLTFTIDFAPTSRALVLSLATLRLDAGRVGIRLTLVEQTSAEVLDDVAGPRGGWDLASWDGGWQYSPDYYPSGEWNFAQGSPWNVGHYDDSNATALVTSTLRSSSALASYTSFLETQLPVVWLPSTVALVETRASIKGVVVSPLGAITPESWRR
jgi:peptide/nickel transport system substrate-binding protein